MTSPPYSDTERRIEPSWHKGWLQVAWVLLAVAGLVGCASWPPELNKKPEETLCDAGLTPADNTRLVAVAQMINEGKHFAALAQLDTLNAEAAKVRLTRADALRRVDKFDEARTLYEGLITQSCFEGRAHHGMGLLLARQSQMEASVVHLRQARMKLPTEARIRSDFGYALMLTGQLQDARFELMTALDLDPQDNRAGRNLVLLTLKQGDTSKAQELANKLGLDKATMDRLHKQASELTPPPLTMTPPAIGAKGEP
jgi:Flp pilus assembly protein TadD